MNYRIKKLTALLTLFVFILLMGVSPVFSESSLDNTALRKAETLKSLGILPASVTAEEFCTKESITRAEIVSAMVKMSGMSKTADENATVYFTDVDDESPYANDIKVALQMGIINGNGDHTFRPDENLTYEAMVKMAIVVLGYDTQAQLAGGFPTGYLQMASRLGLQNIGMEINKDSVTGNNVTAFLYSMLDTDISYVTGVGNSATYTTTEGKTLLTENMKIYTADGILTGDANTDLYDVPNIREGEISIDGVTYKYTGDIKGILGMRVKAYYSEERGSDEKEVVHIEVSDKNRILTVDAEDLSYADGKFSYYDENGKQKEANMYVGAAIVYNGRAVTSADFDMTRLAPTEGNVTLIDNRSAGNYNVVIVSSYTNTVVDSVDEYQELIYDKYLSERNVNLKDLDYEIYDAESGKKLLISDISEYDVLSVMKSDDNSYYIKRSRKTVGGSVNKIASNSEKVYIDDVLYRVSVSYLNSGEKNIEINDNGTFLLDFQGRIAGVKIGRDSSIKVGLVIKTGTDNSMSKEPVIRLMTMLGEEKIYSFASTVEVDGARIKSDENDSGGNNKILSRIALGTVGYSPMLTNETPDGQVIRYTLNSEGKINMVDTSNYDISTETENSLRRSLKYSDGVDVYFKSKNVGGREIVSNETITFIVTTPRSGVTADDYRVTAGSYFGNANYTVETYIYTQDKIGADVAICYIDQSNTVLDSYSSEMLVDDIGWAMGSDGSQKMQVSGWYIGSYSTFVIKDTANIDFDIQEGDLIGFSTDASGEIYMADHIYSAKDDSFAMTPAYRPNDTNRMDGFYYANGYGTFDNGRVFVYGNLYHKFENEIILTKTENLSQMTDTSIQTKVNIGNAYIYVYDRNDNRNTVRLGSKADLISYRKNESNPSRIIVRAREALARTILVIK